MSSFLSCVGCRPRLEALQRSEVQQFSSLVLRNVGKSRRNSQYPITFEPAELFRGRVMLLLLPSPAAYLELHNCPQYFLALAAMLLTRFLRTGGPNMLKMMNKPMHEDHMSHG